MIRCKEILSSVKTWMEPKSTMLSEISQEQRWVVHKYRHSHIEYNKIDLRQVVSRIMVIRDWKFGEEGKKGERHLGSTGIYYINLKFKNSNQEMIKMKISYMKYCWLLSDWLFLISERSWEIGHELDSNSFTSSAHPKLLMTRVL